MATIDVSGGTSFNEIRAAYRIAFAMSGTPAAEHSSLIDTEHLPISMSYFRNATFVDPIGKGANPAAVPSSGAISIDTVFKTGSAGNTFGTP